jgi:hypothetical protein
VRDESHRLQCRFYEEQYPNPESMVMVKVMNIADMAAEVILLEYNDIEVRVLRVGAVGSVDRSMGFWVWNRCDASRRLTAITPTPPHPPRA